MIAQAMAQIEKRGESVMIHLETDEDVWFWERRFNVFDFLELFPSESISTEGAAPAAGAPMHFETDAGFTFETDIVRGGFYLRSQSQGTRRWMAARAIRTGDTIEITRLTPASYRLSRRRPE